MNDCECTTIMARYQSASLQPGRGTPSAILGVLERCSCLQRRFQRELCWIPKHRLSLVAHSSLLFCQHIPPVWHSFCPWVTAVLLGLIAWTAICGFKYPAIITGNSTRFFEWSSSKLVFMSITKIKPSISLSCSLHVSQCFLVISWYGLWGVNVGLPVNDSFEKSVVKLLITTTR